MEGRYDPWVHAAELEVRILFRDLPDDVWGAWHMPSRTVLLRRDLTQCERRATLAHELVHAERGDSCRQNERVEAEVHAIAARRLITIDMLCALAPWATDVATVADECWVDEETAKLRIESMTEEEHQIIRAWTIRRTA